MGTAKQCFAIMVLLPLLSYDAFAYDYTWHDCRTPFSQLVKVPVYTAGTSTVYFDLAEDLINTREELTLKLDVESNLIIKIDGLEQKTFERWTAYCRVNDAGFFGKHKLRVHDLPARQTCSVTIATKDLKAGRNTLEFSMSPTGANVNWSGIYGKIGIAYGIHRMWFSEFSTPPQELPIRKQLQREVETKPEVLDRIKLRDRAETKFSDQDLQKMLKERNFFSRRFNPGGHFPNAFVDNGDATVTDKVTGLMWQKGGSSSEMSFYAVAKYLDELNSIRYGGYGDWRLPTMEELCSLLEANPNQNGKFMDNLFDPAQGICWSADVNPQYVMPGLPQKVNVALCVNFIRGETSVGVADKFARTSQGSCYLKAVRTAE